MKARLKKKSIIIILSITLVIIIGLGTTLSYLTDSDQVTNTFSMGDIKATLTEPNWNANDGKNLFPGTTKIKDPTVIETKGDSYMRIRMEIVDGQDNLITDPDRVELILKTLYYDPTYVYSSTPSKSATSTVKVDQKYSQEELNALPLQKEYNHTDFTFAGILTNTPAVRYYNYTRNNGIFALGTKATLFTNVAVPKDWNNEEIYKLSGDIYTTTYNGGVEVVTKGTGYKIVLKAELIQSAEMKNANEAFTILNEATGVTIDN